jgi:hypothetical protein
MRRDVYKTSPLKNHSFDLTGWLSKAKALRKVTPDSRHLLWSPTNSSTIPVSFDIWDVNTKYVNTLCRKNSGFIQCSSWLNNVPAALDRRTLKADSHIACRAHAVPLPCRALIHTYHAAPLPCSDSAISFVKVRAVVGNIRTASPTI